MLQDRMRLRPREALLRIVGRPNVVHEICKGSLRPLYTHHGWDIVGENLNRLFPSPPDWNRVENTIQSLSVRGRRLHRALNTWLRGVSHLSVSSFRGNLEFYASTAPSWNWDCEVL
jgi:hypothetical protein